MHSRILRWVQQTDKRWYRWRDPEKRRVLINARAPMNYAVMAPVHKAMSNDPRIEIFLTASHAPSRRTEVFSGADNNAQIISPARASIMRFDAYLAADFIWLALPRGARRVQMFHGVAGKYRNVYDTPDHSVRGWDRLFFINRKRLRNFISAGAIDEDSPAARLIGMPKVDCLVDGSLARDTVLKTLGIDPGMRTVLYAPTWSPDSSLNSIGEEVIKGLGAAGYAVIVKLHDRSHDPQYVHSGGVDWVARLSPLARQTGGCIATGGNSCPYMVGADALITDHSSVGFEYMLLDRPIVRIEMPDLLARANVNPDYVELLSEASITVKDAKQAIAAIEQGFADPMRHSSERRAVAEELFHNPGKATEQAVRELYEVLELDRAR